MKDSIIVSDAQWAAVQPLFPKHGPQDEAEQRSFFEGVVYVLRHGCGWRALPEKYGEWNSVFQRYNR